MSEKMPMTPDTPTIPACGHCGCTPYHAADCPHDGEPWPQPSPDTPPPAPTCPACGGSVSPLHRSEELLMCDHCDAVRAAPVCTCGHRYHDHDDGQCSRCPCVRFVEVVPPPPAPTPASAETPLTDPEWLEEVDDLILFHEGEGHTTDFVDRDEYKALKALRRIHADALQRLQQAEQALQKIDAIRNDIVGRQKLGWSAHVYPLVAALGDAGYPGEGYDIASHKAETLVRAVEKAEQRAEAAEQENTALRQRVAELEQERDHERHEKETVSDASQATVRWLRQRVQALEAERTAIITAVNRMTTFDQYGTASGAAFKEAVLDLFVSLIPTNSVEPTSSVLVRDSHKGTT